MTLLPSSDVSSAPDPPVVIVVDDDNDVRNGIVLLARSVGLTAQAYASGVEFLSQCNSPEVGCVVLDVRMPGISGLDLQRELSSRSIHLPIIFVTAHGEVSLATQALRAGAFDFIQKPYSPQALLERIQEAVSSSIDQHQKARQAGEFKRKVDTLTKREREVMQLLVDGASAKTIAHQLAISPKTVENHRTRILEKCGLDNVTQLANLLFKTK